MSIKLVKKVQLRLRRRARVRARVEGTANRPRLSVFRSTKGLLVQLIDDQEGKTLVSANTKKDVDGSIDAGDRTGKVKDAYIIGKTLAQKAKEKNIEKVVFDRGGYAYHGRVQAVADGARDGGLVF